MGEKLFEEEKYFKEEEIDLEEVAIEAVGGGEQYMPVDDVIAQYPDFVTVNGCHAFHFKNEVGTVFTFAEDSSRCFPVKSGDLPKIYEAFVDRCGGDESKVCRLLKEKPVKMKIYKVKNGNKTYVKAQIIRSERK